MAEVITRKGSELTLQVTIKLTGSIMWKWKNGKMEMEMENTILDGCNELGCLATAEALQKFDTDGSPIKLGDTKMTARVKAKVDSTLKCNSCNHAASRLFL
ncbi:hypothetical protein [Bathymodiolus platifrons methanotrophic gill symbiont]|uniref:hypothetical protein n=1 Tax=Bathymodiolus platifrons methanotrophic gill symbiont TaxID=113268 RepID=UPI001C8D6E22|nr:hypothetical protein [Bathymodiolus platifrons methanotrophic gill symbiont]